MGNQHSFSKLKVIIFLKECKKLVQMLILLNFVEQKKTNKIHYRVCQNCVTSFHTLLIEKLTNFLTL